MALRKSERGRLDEQLLDEFGVNPSAWNRIMVIYKQHLYGDKFATTLINQMESGDITPAKAERLLREAQDDYELLGNTTSVKLPDLRDELLRLNGYLNVTLAALRRGLRVNTGNLSVEDVAGLIELAESVGSKTTRVADLLVRAIPTGGSTVDDH